MQAAFRMCKLDQKLAEYRFVQEWSDIVGKDLAKVCRPAGMKKELLFVAVPNSVWAQEMTFHKEFILKRLEKYLSPDQVLSDIKFLVEEQQ